MTTGQGNKASSPKKSTPGKGTDEDVVRQVEDYVIDRVVGSEGDDAGNL